MKTIFALTGFVFILIPSFCQEQSAGDDTSYSSFTNLQNKYFSPLLLEDTCGHLFNTSSLLGKTVYVDFWFTACAPCIKEIPFSKCLQTFFQKDSNVVFLSICIEDKERKPAWKKMVKEKEMAGIHLFYARNQPQEINLLREYNITFPTYLIINKEMKVVDFNAARPSEQGDVEWMITEAEKGEDLSLSYQKVVLHSKEYTDFIDRHLSAINACSEIR